MHKKPVEFNQYSWERELQEAWAQGFAVGITLALALVFMVALWMRFNA